MNASDFAPDSLSSEDLEPAVSNPPFLRQSTRSPRMLLGMAGMGLLLIAAGMTMWFSQSNQDIRQQAAVTYGEACAAAGGTCNTGTCPGGRQIGGTNDCRSGAVCCVTSGSSNAGACSPLNPRGSCPAGERCDGVAGVCVASGGTIAQVAPSPTPTCTGENQFTASDRPCCVGLSNINGQCQKTPAQKTCNGENESVASNGLPCCTGLVSSGGQCKPSSSVDCYRPQGMSCDSSSGEISAATCQATGGFLSNSECLNAVKKTLTCPSSTPTQCTCAAGIRCARNVTECNDICQEGTRPLTFNCDGHRPGERYCASNGAIIQCDSTGQRVVISDQCGRDQVCSDGQCVKTGLFDCYQVQTENGRQVCKATSRVSSATQCNGSILLSVCVDNLSQGSPCISAVNPYQCRCSNRVACVASQVQCTNLCGGSLTQTATSRTNTPQADGTECVQNIQCLSDNCLKFPGAAVGTCQALVATEITSTSAVGGCPAGQRPTADGSRCRVTVYKASKRGNTSSGAESKRSL